MERLIVDDRDKFGIPIDLSEEQTVWAFNLYDFAQRISKEEHISSYDNSHPLYEAAKFVMPDIDEEGIDFHMSMTGKGIFLWSNDWVYPEVVIRFIQVIMRRFNLTEPVEIGSCSELGGRAVFITRDNYESMHTRVWLGQKYRAHKREILFRNFDDIRRQIDYPTVVGEPEKFKCRACGSEDFSMSFLAKDAVRGCGHLYTDGEFDAETHCDEHVLETEEWGNDVHCDHCQAIYLVPSLRRYYPKR